MSTYIKNGMIHGKFNIQRNLKYDQLGKDLAAKFFENQGGKIYENDLNENGIRLFENPDMRVDFKKLNKTIFIEIEVKSDKNWSYIFNGIDIPARKIKYSFNTNSQGFFFMAKEDCQEFLLIPMRHMQNASDDCGDQYLGQSSKWGAVRSSENFIMPIHECHRVRKHCYYEGNITLEDFVRIPFKYCMHYSINEEGHFKLNK